MNEEIKQLKDKIYFLETLLEMNAETLKKAIETNRVLIDQLKKQKL